MTSFMNKLIIENYLDLDTVEIKISILLFAVVCSQFYKIIKSVGQIPQYAYNRFKLVRNYIML